MKGAEGGRWVGWRSIQIISDYHTDAVWRSRGARLAAGGAFTYKLFVTAVIISTTGVRVASTKADLNISKVVFRLDDGHVVIKVIPSPGVGRRYPRMKKKGGGGERGEEREKKETRE